MPVARSHKPPPNCNSWSTCLPKSELSLLSKNSLLPTRWTMISQELTERVQHIRVARMASVANTLPWVFASCRWIKIRNGKIVQSFTQQRRTDMSSKGNWRLASSVKGAPAYLADHGVISGGNSVKDPLDALEWFLIASGDAIKSLVVVLKSSTAFTEKKKKKRSNEGLYQEHCTYTILWNGSWQNAYMSAGSATSMYLIFMSLGKSISSFTSQSLRTSTEESLGLSWAYMVNIHFSTAPKWCTYTHALRGHYFIAVIMNQTKLTRLNPCMVWH